MAKLLIDGFSTKSKPITRSFVCLSAHPRSTCPVRISWELTVRRRRLGTRWRRLTPGRQALLVLAHLRCGDTCTRLAMGFGVGLATVCHYIHEAVGLLAALAPDLVDAVKSPREAYVILGGTLLRIDRIAADRP